jgi:hypothetical protein
MRKCALLLLAMEVAAVSAVPFARAESVSDKYKIIQVQQFAIEKNVDFPANYFTHLQEELVAQLKESQKFSAVLQPSETPANPDQPRLCLSGTVTRFDPGSRAKRYFGGYGAGAARVYARVIYRDCASGNTVLEEDVIGTLSGGSFGGDTRNVAREFARAVVNTTKLVLQKSLPANGSTIAQAQKPEIKDVGGSAPAESTAAERKVLSIKSDDFPGAEQKLNQEGAAGFRLVRFDSTGNKSADLTLEVTEPQRKYEYRLLHAMLAGNLEKQLNKAGAEGFRLVPHTISAMGGFSLIVEKTQSTVPGQFAYHFETAMRMGNAEKNVREHEAKGFMLVDISERQALHIVVLEKVSD